jgi:hypothetical protein
LLLQRLDSTKEISDGSALARVFVIGGSRDLVAIGLGSSIAFSLGELTAKRKGGRYEDA